MDDATGREDVATAWLERLRGLSEMAERVADHDWASTPLGEIHTWPAGLRAASTICLSSRFPMVLVWGPDLLKIYNDAYIPFLGTDKHPQALGAPAREVWAEIWPEIGPLFSEALAGRATWVEKQRLDFSRNGFVEEGYFTYSYSPLPDDDGRVGGVLDTTTEDTAEVVGQRRLACIGELSNRMVGALQVTDVCVRAVAVLGHHPDDLRATEVHLWAGDELIPVAASHRTPTDVATAATVREVAAGGTPLLLDPDWEEGRPANRYAAPIGDLQAGGVVVFGLSPLRPFDDRYRQYLDVVAETIGAAVQNAYRRSVELGEQRHISDTLQNAMLVPAADIPTVAARYLPAVGNLSVGGDWYDVITLPDGRRALVVGDCVGHGLNAATAMGQLRTASRTLLLEGRSPREVIESMDRFATSVDGAKCATMICAVIDVSKGTVEYSSAGHVPPLVVRADGCEWLEGGRGAPLAVVDVRRQESVTELAEGDLLVLYTDGLVERRAEDIDVGLGRLRDAAQALADEPVQDIADGLLDALRDPEGRDDVALVVKRMALPDRTPG